MRTAIYLILSMSIMFANSTFAMGQSEGTSKWMQLLISSWLTVHLQRPEQELPASNLKKLYPNTQSKYKVKKTQQPRTPKKRLFSQHHK